MKANIASNSTVEKVCKECKSKFLVYKSTLKTRPYSYCSEKCYQKNKVILIGESNPNWKGDKVGYFALHSWINRKLGKASKCSNCKSTKNVEWANISGKYKRILSDWKQLCRSCHHVFDDIASKRQRDIKGRFI